MITTGCARRVEFSPCNLVPFGVAHPDSPATPTLRRFAEESVVIQEDHGECSLASVVSPLAIPARPMLGGPGAAGHEP